MIYKFRLCGADRIDPAAPTKEAPLRAGLVGVFGRKLPCEGPEAEGPAGAWGMLHTPDAADPNPEPLQLVALHFDGEAFSLEKALDWVQKYGYTVDALEFARQWFGSADTAAFSDEYVEREADLFEAGDYPDRNLTVTEADIARLAQTAGPVPIQIEHSGGPIQLGEVTGLSAAGRWLKGRLRLFPEADALLERLGVRTLSVAVSRALDRVAEVSVTGTPRVAGAQMFSGESELAVFALGETPERGFSMPDDKAVTSEQFSALQSQVALMQEKLEAERAGREKAEGLLAATSERAAAVEFAMRVQSATATVDPLCASGILPPVCKDAAVALLLASGTVRFADGEKSPAEVFRVFLEQFTQASPRRFAAALTGDAAKAVELSPEQAEFFSRHYPDLDKAELAKSVAMIGG